jgi:hypothetical protein
MRPESGKGRPVLRLLGFVVLLCLGAGGLMAIDFNRARQATGADETISFRAYLDTVPDRIASFTASSTASRGRPVALADMLPAAPEGWTVRVGEAKDVEVFQPKGRREGTPEARDMVKSVGSAGAPKGGEVVILAYEKGERRVVIQARRYPDSLFTEDSAADKRLERQTLAAAPTGRAFMTVRGLDVTEEFLGDGMRGRYFRADVGAQISLRILASKRMKDTDLLPFFEGLHVKALNGAVVDRAPGLGELPVILLASAMDDAGREAYAADRALRRERALAQARDQHAAAVARVAVADEAAAAGGTKPAPDEPQEISCKKGDGGVKRCKVSSGG